MQMRDIDDVWMVVQPIENVVMERLAARMVNEIMVTPEDAEQTGARIGEQMAKFHEVIQIFVKDITETLNLE